MPILAQAVSIIDWSIVAVFLAGVVGVGLWVGRKKTEGKDFFLAGRNIPAWAAAISLVATALSAATFIGGPADSFGGNLSYLALNIGSIVGGLVAAWWLIPAAWRAGGATPYALLELRGGLAARRGAGSAFLVGRLLASGVRHMITGTAFCYLAFGKLDHAQACGAIIVCGVLGTLYAAKGGVKSVIWTDLILFCMLLVAVVACFIVIWRAVPVGAGQVVQAMQESKKLTVFELSINPANAYTLWAALASILFFVAAYGADQDLAQRMLTTDSPKSASRSMVMGVLAAIPLNILFLFLGVCLWVYYQRADLMRVPKTEAVGNAAMVFPQFIRDHLPVGIKGLLMAGLASTSLGALASAITAMSSSICTDVLPAGTRANPRWVSLGVGAALTAAALGCYGAFVWDNEKSSLIQFALGVMTVAYAGLLGVFACVLLTRRGTTASILAALAIGAVIPIVLWFVPVVPLIKNATGEHWIPDMVGDAGVEVVWKRLAFPWVMLLGTLASFLVCMAGKAKPNQIIFDA